MVVAMSSLKTNTSALMFAVSNIDPEFVCESHWKVLLNIVILSNLLHFQKPLHWLWGKTTGLCHLISCWLLLQERAILNGLLGCRLSHFLHFHISNFLSGCTLIANYEVYYCFEFHKQNILCN